MPRTKTAVKTNPYTVHIESLRRKQQELLDSYERDKAAWQARVAVSGEMPSRVVSSDWVGSLAPGAACSAAC